MDKYSISENKAKCAVVETETLVCGARQVLQFIESVHPISHELKQHLTTVIKERRLAKREYLLKAGHVSRSACFVQSGLLRCFYIKGDTEVCSWFMKEGDVIISIESFYSQSKSYESIQALEDCVINYIEYSELQAIYRQFAEFNFVGRVLTEKYHVLWAQQLYALRMQPAPERYRWLLTNYPELALRVPGKYIASYLGIEETTLSRIKKMKR